jgi:ankyrin repeat protein
MLLAHNCSPDVQSKQGWNALMIAVEKGHKDIVNALLAHNCNVDLQTNNACLTALMIAAREGHKDIVDVLLAHNCSPDVQNNHGITALMIAADKGHRNIVDALLAHNCSLDVQTNNNGWTALILAADKGHRDIVDMLIRQKCKLDLRDNNGNTALALAQRHNHVEVVALIENQLRRNRNWDHRKALMLVLLGSNYLLPSSLSAAVDSGRVVQTQVVIQRVDAALTTSSEKVLCDLFLVQHIMRYI